MKNTGRIKPQVGEKCLVCVPFTYPYGFVTSTIMSLLCGRTAILAPNLSKDNIRYYLSKNPNYIFGSPALLELIKRNVCDNDDLSSILNPCSFNQSLASLFLSSDHLSNVSKSSSLNGLL